MSLKRRLARMMVTAMAGMYASPIMIIMMVCDLVSAMSTPPIPATTINSTKVNRPMSME